jgi:hypothetical protein
MGGANLPCGVAAVQTTLTSPPFAPISARLDH